MSVDVGTDVFATEPLVVRRPRYKLLAQRPMRVGGWSLEKSLVPASVAVAVGVAMFWGVVGADARWLAALGQAVVAAGRIPHGIQFAAAPTVHWYNVTALAEVVFWTLEHVAGDRGLVLAQTLAVGVAFGVLARGALRAGASRQAIASTSLLVTLGAFSSLAIARVQLFSLALFPVLLELLRSDARERSHRIWLVVPVLALWSNLHGSALVGLLATLVYLIVARVRERPLETIAVAALCPIALCVNPAGIHTLSYFSGVLSNAAAQRGEGMWAPLSLTAPLDVLFIGVAVVLSARAIRARPVAWEGIVILMLAAMSIHAARSGIWLLFMLYGPAAVGTGPGSPWRRRAVLIVGASVAAIVLGTVRGPLASGTDGRTIAQAIHLAQGTPILASDIAAEQIAMSGGRVWASDPIDAFQPQVQATYLDWMDGRSGALKRVGRSVRVVLVSRGSREAAVMQRNRAFRAVGNPRGFELFERTRAR
jgi:hypothetical protein